MSFIAMTTDTAGQIGYNPRTVRLVSTDSLSTITTVGYIPASELQTFPLYPTDIIICNYASNKTAFLQPIMTTAGLALQELVGSLQQFDVTVTAAALAAGGSVTLVTSYPTQQWKVRTLQLNLGGTNFSGGGGDRLGQVTDGTSVYTVIPAADMQTLVNAQWGTTALPNPASVAIDTSTVAGANLVFKYSGGTTDYTTGSLVITGMAHRVT
jgi:hypothetical protein